MGVREWINSNPAGMTTVAAIVLALALVIVLWQSGGAGVPTPPDAFYYDLEAEEVFVAAGDRLAPIETPAGGQRGVRAHVYACDACPDDLAGLTLEELEARGAFVGWLERYTPEVKAVLEEYRQRDTDEPLEFEDEARFFEAEAQGPVVRRPDGSRWHRLDSEAGVTVMDAPMERCEGQRVQRCTP